LGDAIGRRMEDRRMKTQNRADSVGPAVGLLGHEGIAESGESADDGVSGSVERQERQRSDEVDGEAESHSTSRNTVGRGKLRSRKLGFLACSG